jgi:serine/threonine protein kinase
MGEVYRARDTRLDRIVALKILPKEFSCDPVRKQRFEQEAKTISSLNHPHICVLHDVGHQDGIDFLVMECVEGETLAKRLEKGPMPLEQVLKFGAQIADALDKAHRSGVVHRDLKPGNIMLTPTGAKLLDFGLAKPAVALVSGSTLTVAARPSPMTQEGTIVGTFQYMSPEQVEGKELDGRSDIFSLGAVLYEMVTGRRAFEGKSQLSVASAILEKEPVTISSIKPLTPPALDYGVRKCLAKVADERWQNASDLASHLKWVAESGSQAGLPIALQSKWKLRENLAWGAAAIAAILAAVFAVSYHLRSPEDPRVTRAFILPPEKTTFAPVGISGGPVTISPDGRLLAFSARDESGKQLLWIRPLDSVTARILPGTEEAGYPFWSPDSQFVAFFAGGTLKKVAAAGGPVQSLCGAPEGRGGTWNKEGVILFTPSIRSGLLRVSEAGGTPVPVTKAESQPDASHRWPQFLPDGRHFLYFARGKTNGIYIGTLDSEDTKLILQSEGNATYSEGGQLLWWRESALIAQPFDLRLLQLRGSATPVAEHVLFSYGQSFGVFSVSQNGILVFQRGGTSGNTQLWWFDHSGKQLGNIGERDFLDHPRISPDGQRIAAGIVNATGNQEDIWLYDIARNVRSRFTLSQSGRYAVWSPDGSRIAYASVRSSQLDLFVKASNGTGQEQLLLDVPGSKVPWSWSSDGRFLAYMLRDPQPARDKSDIWILPLFGDRKPFPFLQSDFDKGAPSFSPDGRWIAYVSEESGTREVYVVSFPDPRTRLQVSNQGGLAPMWRPDGKQLFYASLGGQLTSVGVSSKGSTLQLESPKPLFQAFQSSAVLRVFATGPFGLGTQPFDISRDGQRFLIVTAANPEPTPITVVVNWDAELRKK